MPQATPSPAPARNSTGSPTTQATLALITRFENAFNTRDFDAIMADMSADTIVEHIAPASSSFGRYTGQEAVRAFWESMESHFPEFDLRPTDIFASEERAACQWEMSWRTPEGTRTSCRGCDIFTVRHGKITHKLIYVSM